MGRRSSRRKRSSEADEDGGEEAVETKRQAVEDDEEEEPAAEDDEAYKSAEEGADEDEDEEMEDVEDEAEDGESNDSPPSSPFRQINKAGKPPEAGIIKSIYIENFMCHRKLTVDLCRNVNFINGSNGSGKSAILASIQICLGAGARRTNRARNLKDLVRKDGSGSSPTHARIRVTVLNGGDDAYKPEIYGDSISVERHITLGSGYNGYKLLDSNLVEKSRSKKDLDEMLDMLNIQVENPVSVLDQEEAKKFLMGKGNDKYSFFMKATELERVDRSYAESTDRLFELEDAQERIKSSLAQNQQHVEALKAKWDEHQKLQVLRDKEAELGVKVAWAWYQQQQEEFEKASVELELVQAKISKRLDEFQKAEEIANKPDAERDAKMKRISELLEESGEQEQLKDEADAELRALLGPFKQLKRDHLKLVKEKDAAKAGLEAAKRRLNAARAEALAKAGSAKTEEARRAEALAAAEKKLEEAESQVDQLKETVHVHLRGYEELDPHLSEAKNKVRHAESKSQQTRNVLNNLQRSNDEFALLGEKVRPVYEEIQKAKRAGKFKGEVVGPFAKYIKISPGKEKFAGLAELAMGYGMLDRFILTDKADLSLVNKIRAQVGCTRQCGLFVEEPTDRFNVRAPPVAGIETVESVLSISNDLVFNCLVNQATIELKALADDRSDSENKLLERDGSNKLSIKGQIKACYCLPNGDYWKVSGSGNKAIISNDRKGLRQTIGVDKTAAVETAKRDLEQYQAELREAREKESKLNSEHTKHQRAWNQARREMRDNDSLISDLRAKLQDLRAEMDEAAADVAVDTAEYEEDVAQQEIELKEATEREAEFKEKVNQAKPPIEEAKKRKEEVIERANRIMEEVTAAQEDLVRYTQTQSQHKELVEKRRKKLEQAQGYEGQYQEKLDECTSERDQSLVQARKIQWHYIKTMELREQNGDDNEAEITVPEPTEEELEAIEIRAMKKNYDYLKAKFAKAKEKVAEEKRKSRNLEEDPAVVYERYINAKEALEKKTDDAKKNDDRIVGLAADLNARRKRWRRIQKALSNKIPIKFKEMLNLNKYSGDLTFDHADKTLQLAVEKGIDGNGSKAQDVKSLSGGERSYTTMCLLLALGEYLETPFRILDEFDVFLDTQARKLTMQALIATAKQMEHRQFIFITPQDLGSVKPDPQLKIFKLNPPERYDKVGGPTQQTLNFGSQK